MAAACRCSCSGAFSLSIFDQSSTSWSNPLSYKLVRSSNRRAIRKACVSRQRYDGSARNFHQELPSTAVSRTELSNGDASSLATEGKEDKMAKLASGAIAGLMVGTLCLSSPAMADFLSYDHADMRGADLSGQDLSGAVFAACDCRKINLSGSKLDGTTDTFAGFQGANLQNTSWIRAFADRVVFREADLRNANFTNAILSGSQFDGANVTGADFTEAIVDNSQRLKMCKKATGTNPVTGIETRESLFC